MSPADLAQRLAALDWSSTSLQHQLAVGAAVETLKGIELMTVAFRPVIDARADVACNVIALPVRPRTCWTTICHLDGRQWAMSSHFGPGGAWAWIVESVMSEWGISENQISGAESGEDQPYDCDDLVLVDGLPLYRIQHLCK